MQHWSLEKRKRNFKKRFYILIFNLSRYKTFQFTNWSKKIEYIT